MANNIVSSILQTGLYIQIIGKRILYYTNIASTMDKAREEAEEGSDEGLIVIAEEQSNARGRFKREWISPPGNIYLSILLRPTMSVLPYISLISGLSVVKSINKSTELQSATKWPNDVIIGNKKVAGILTEGVISKSNTSYSIVGIGINVNANPTTMSNKLSMEATSLSDLTHTSVSREKVLLSLIHELDQLYVSASNGIFPVEEFRQTIDTLGKPIDVTWRNERYSGIAEDIDENGNLILRLNDGSVKTLLAGEVTLR